jgi:hypothetical protein
MSWLSSWWDKASGKNQKYDPKKLGTEFDTAMGDVNKGYDKISAYAEGMMDPNSQQNMAQRAMMDAQGADAAAESARLAGRNAAMAGGAPAASLAMQTDSSANQAMAQSNQAFNQYLQGAQGQGASMLSGVLANQGQMQNQKFQMMQNQRQANAQADTQGAQFAANLAGSALSMIPGLPFQEGGMAYDEVDNLIDYDTYYQQGGSVGPDGRQHYLVGGLTALAGGVGLGKKVWDAVGGKEGISEGWKGLKEGVGSSMEAMKEQAEATDYHYDEEGARDALMGEYEASDAGKAELAKLGDVANVTSDELAHANTGLMAGDEGYQTSEMIAQGKVDAHKATTRSGFDLSQGAHQVGAGRALAEDIQPYTSGAYGMVKEGAGLLGKAGLATAGALGAGVGKIGEGLGKAGQAIGDDWAKGDKSVGRNVVSGVANLLKEVGSPGYLRGKEMAKIKNEGKLGLKEIGSEPLGGERDQPAPEKKTEAKQGPSGVEIDDGKGGNILNPLEKKAKKESSVFETRTESPAGHQPSDVTGAQQKLVDMGYDIGKTGADGKWGPKSKAAYAKYQADLESGKIDEEGIYQFGWDQKQQGGLIHMAEGGSIGAIWDKTKEFAEESGSALLEGTHTTLDALGMIPGLGIVPDMMNAGIYGAEALLAGDDVSRKEALGLMGLSGAAAIPIAGQLATGAKYAHKGSKMMKKADKVADAIPYKVSPGDRAIYNRAVQKQQDIANPKYNKWMGDAHVGNQKNPYRYDEPKWADPSKRQIVGSDGVDQISGLPVQGHPAGKFQEGGLIGQVVGPNGPSLIKTRLGGMKIG